jgi:hypothetical protein
MLAVARRPPLTFAGDERDELGDAFLHALLGFFGNLRVLGQRGFHDAGDWSKVTDVSIRVAAIGWILRRPLLG